VAASFAKRKTIGPRIALRKGRLSVTNATRKAITLRSVEAARYRR
jgi:hypothetical protein